MATLKRLSVKNYRCLADVDVPLESLTAFVGPNGAGKTSLLRALDIILGDVWPTLRSFRIPQDFTNFDPSRDIEINVEFDPPYVHCDTHSTKHQISVLQLTCKPYKKSGKWGDAGDLHVDLNPLNEERKVPNVAVSKPEKGRKTQYGPLRVGTDLRDHARILFMDHRRSLAQHLPSVRGSILGRILQKARKEFTAQDDFKAKYEAAMETLRTDQVKNIEKTIAETAKRMLGFLGQSAVQSVEIAFGFVDPANPFNSLRLEYRESGLIVPGEELGLGIQSAMVVGIFEAFRQLGGTFGTIVIEEPEMYLHPQAQRYFYRLLCEMVDAKQCQVIYSTHSSIFADVNRFEDLRVMRKDNGRTTVAYVCDERRQALMEARKNFKLGNRFDVARNELLFANKALLTEGFGDKVAALIVADKLGFDLDAEGVAVVDCGGKAGIELVIRVCQALQIPFVVLHDEDVWSLNDIDDLKKREKQKYENEDEQRKNRRIKDIVGMDDLIYIISPSLEAALDIGRDAHDKPRRVAEAMEKVDIQNPPHDLAPLILAVKTLINNTNK